MAAFIIHGWGYAYLLYVFTVEPSQGHKQQEVDNQQRDDDTESDRITSQQIEEVTEDVVKVDGIYSRHRDSTGKCIGRWCDFATQA